MGVNREPILTWRELKRFILVVVVVVAALLLSLHLMISLPLPQVIIGSGVQIPEHSVFSLGDTLVCCYLSLNNLLLRRLIDF